MGSFFIVSLLCCTFFIFCSGVDKKVDIVKTNWSRGRAIKGNRFDPKYKAIALEALKVHQRLKDNREPHHVEEVLDVSLVINPGRTTNLNFTAAPNCVISDNGQCKKKVMPDMACSSETWETPWTIGVLIKIVCTEL